MNMRKLFNSEFILVTKTQNLLSVKLSGGVTTVKIDSVSISSIRKLCVQKYFSVPRCLDFIIVSCLATIIDSLLSSSTWVIRPSFVTKLRLVTDWRFYLFLFKYAMWRPGSIVQFYCYIQSLYILTKIFILLV